MLRVKLETLNRLQGDMSDPDFSRMIGISRSHLWRLRRGESAIGPDTIEKIMKTYPDIDLNDLFEA